MQKVLRRMFAEENYSVLIAGDGQAGLDSFRAHRPMAVLLDLILPHISGRELCQSIKRRSAVRRRSLFSARLPRLWIKFCCWSWERTIM